MSLPQSGAIVVRNSALKWAPKAQSWTKMRAIGADVRVEANRKEPSPNLTNRSTDKAAQDKNTSTTWSKRAQLWSKPTEQCSVVGFNPNLSDFGRTHSLNVVEISPTLIETNQRLSHRTQIWSKSTQGCSTPVGAGQRWPNFEQSNQVR